MSRLNMTQTNKFAMFLVLLLFVLPVSQISSLQLGDGTQASSTVFVKVLDDVSDVCCEDPFATYAIKTDGSSDIFI